MKRIFLIISLTVLASALFAQADSENSPLDNVSVNYLDKSFSVYDKLQKTIWSDPELGFLETKSSALLQNHLKSNGFTVEAGVASMPTAFVASYGSGHPVIAVLAEFDALPGLSQDTVPYRKPLVEGGAGHGCGHNTFGVGAAAGAVAIKQWLSAGKHKGTIKVFGTPAEEGGGGKVYMVRDGLFKDVDIVLDWHPGTGNGVTTGTGTAIQMVDYSFYGIATHAAGSPDKGRSALDGVESLNYMVNMLREHVPTSSRIHYVISNGGEAPNVVPDYARVSYYIRSPKREILKDLVEWIGQAAEGAALGTQTKVKSEIISGFYERLNNRKLSELVQRNLEIVGGVHYDARERAFAEEIAKGLNKDISALKEVESVKPLADEKPSNGGGSSDVGDISWVVPTVSFNTATFVPGSAGHSWQNVAVGGTTIGTKSLINTAKVFSLSAIELYTNPQLVKEIKDEFEKRRGADFKYEPLLGDRKPALDYRVKK
jgi:aminobenzoyl-glutamate utilization protein B